MAEEVPAAPPKPVAATPAQPRPAGCNLDFSTTCPTCQVPMMPVHSHYQCTRCGWRDSCCF